MAATAFAAGSLGGLVALWRERTFQALALSVLCLVLYLCVVQARRARRAELVAARTGRWRRRGSTRSWRCCTSWSRRRTGRRSPPAYGFALVMLVLCVAAERRSASGSCGSGTRAASRSCSGRRRTDDGRRTRRYRAKAHAAPGTVRQVWANPILWREIRTLAYGRRPLLVKLAYGVVLALICYFAVRRAALARRPAGVRRRLRPGAGRRPEPAAGRRPGGHVDHVRARRQGARPAARHRPVSPRSSSSASSAGCCTTPRSTCSRRCCWRSTTPSTGRSRTRRERRGSRSSDNFGPLLCVLGALLVLFAFVMMLGLHVALRIEN